MIHKAATGNAINKPINSMSAAAVLARGNIFDKIIELVGEDASHSGILNICDRKAEEALPILEKTTQTPAEQDVDAKVIEISNLFNNGITGVSLQALVEDLIDLLAAAA